MIIISLRLAIAVISNTSGTIPREGYGQWGRVRLTSHCSVMLSLYRKEKSCRFRNHDLHYKVIPKTRCIIQSQARSVVAASGVCAPFPVMVKLSDAPAVAGFHLVKGVIRVYDVVTYPVYYVIQRPWLKKQKYDRIRAVQEDPSDPYSSWVRVGDPPSMIIDKCTTLDELMRTCIDAYRDRKCMGYRPVLEEFTEEQADGKLFVKKKLDDHYKFLTYHEVGVRLDHIMRGLLLNGLKPGDTLIFFLETRMEWMLTAQALYRMAGCVATVYATLGDEGIIHVINELGSTHLITSSDLLPKIKNLSHKLPNLKTIIYLEDHLKHKDVSDHGFEGTGKHLIRFTDMEADGRSAPEAVIGRPPKTDDVALIMYTSGSTGVPKGVMALHSNYMAALKSLYTVLPDLNIKPDDMDVCFLPLAHNLEFTKHHMGFATGITTAYSSPLTLTDAGAALAPGIRGDIILIKPASLVIVPLVLDRIRKAVIEKIDKKGKFARLMFDFAIEYKNEWVGRGFRTPIINYLLCRPVRAGLGGNLRGVFCGGALLSPVTQRFTKACMDVTVMQAYGSTETLAVATMMDVFDWSEGMAGAPVFGSKVRLVDWDEGGYHPTDKPRPRGEIVVGGASITAGYLKQADVTADAYREENGERWFYTGDIGEFYPNGRIKIIDRKKDLLKLALGEYVSLGKVESELKNCVYVDNICVYGDPLENFVIALIIPNVNAVKSLVQHLHLGSELTDCQVKTQYSDPRVEAEVLKAVVAHGRGVGLHKSEIPQRIKLCPEDWTPENNLLTPGLKIRRRQIQDFYKHDIKRMYQGLDKGSAVDQNGNIISTSK